MSDKVDMFEFLKHIDLGDFDYYPSLTEDQKKSVSFFMANRWMSCTKNKSQLLSVNSIINPLVFPFGTKHKDLLYKLMLIASSGTEKHYKWVGKKKKSQAYPVSSEVVSEYYGISTSRAMGYIGMLSMNDVLDCATSLGYDDASIKKIKNEFKP